MKKPMGFRLRWLSNAIAAIFVFILATLMVFSIQATLRETQTRFEAAPVTGRFIPTGEGEIFIQEMGPASGPAVVFIHGAGAWSELWRETMTALSDAGFRCIALDLPPFGFSERSNTSAYGRVDQAKRIIAVLDALHISTATLVGHSFGGGATVETALMIPNRIQAMVLVDIGGLGLTTNPPPPSNQPSVLKIVCAVRPLRNAVVASTVTNPLLSKKLLEMLILDPADATQARITIVQQPLVLKNSTDTLGNWLLATLTTQEVSLSSDSANYHTLKMPVLLVWGENDTIVPLTQGKQLNTLLPNSELVVMPQVNHIPHIEDTSAFNDIVLGFFRELLR